jgi:hypothetical protein
VTTKRSKRLFATLGLSATLLLAGGAQATTIDVSYEISVNTSSVEGTDGYLDFQFNPGGFTPVDSASATLTGFFTDGTLTTEAPPLGAVTGSLPGTVTIDNTGSTNEYTPGITYGSFFDIFVTLDIPTVSGGAASGSSFTLDVEDSVFRSLLGSFPAVEIDLDATTGNPAVTNNSGGAATVTVAPEPGSQVLVVSGLAGLCMGRRFLFRARLALVSQIFTGSVPDFHAPAAGRDTGGILEKLARGASAGAERE